jgi:hypothetical protein
MTQPVTSPRPGWLGPPPLPTPPSAPPPREASSLPEPDAGSPGQRPVRLPPVIASRAVAAHAPPAVVAARLDAFLARATPTFRTDEGSVAVTIPFRMSTYPPVSPADESVLVDAAARVGVSPLPVGLLHTGRATPELVARLTQSLIDGGHLPPSDPFSSDTLGDRVRRMMGAYGLGLDCAGYVAQASLAARGIGWPASGFAPAQNENLSDLPGKGYVKVPLVDWLRPGDVFALAPDEQGPYGHRAIVREVGPASASELQELKTRWSLPPSARASDRWLRVVVDSSWGSSEHALIGGVQRRTWWCNLTSGDWAWRQGDLPVVTSGPYGHKVWSAYTPPGSR